MVKRTVYGSDFQPGYKSAVARGDEESWVEKNGKYDFIK